MSHEGFTRQHRMLGRTAAFAVFSLLIMYAVTLTLGLLSLKSPLDPIGDPFFTILELLTKNMKLKRTLWTFIFSISIVINVEIGDK